jgi:hypothetical protein
MQTRVADKGLSGRQGDFDFLSFEQSRDWQNNQKQSRTRQTRAENRENRKPFHASPCKTKSQIQRQLQPVSLYFRRLCSIETVSRI